jgi:mRNA-degrading endonuclease RelE of RelBE toxin-antitoxin system
MKEMASLPRRDCEALITKAEAFAGDPFASHPWASPLRGAADRVRIRQGDLRAVVLILRASETVVLERVANRREVYR